MLDQARAKKSNLMISFDPGTLHDAQVRKDGRQAPALGRAKVEEEDDGRLIFIRSPTSSSSTLLPNITSRAKATSLGHLPSPTPVPREKLRDKVLGETV